MVLFNKKQNTHEETGVDIGTTGEVAVVNTSRRMEMTVDIDGSASADFEVQVSPDAADWETVNSYSAASSTYETFDIAQKYLRVVVTAAAASGETADITIQGEV